MIYLSGKITGNPDYEEDFRKAEDYMKALGLVGKCAIDENSTFYNPAHLPDGKTPVEYMRICFAALEMASIVVLLPNWTDSAGAKLEHDYAKYIGKKIIYLST